MTRKSRNELVLLVMRNGRKEYIVEPQSQN